MLAPSYFLDVGPLIYFRCWPPHIFKTGRDTKNLLVYSSHEFFKELLEKKTAC